MTSPNSDRGQHTMPAMECRDGTRVMMHDSSNAVFPSVWLSVVGDGQLTLAEAVLVAKALLWLVAYHYSKGGRRVMRGLWRRIFVFSITPEHLCDVCWRSHACGRAEGHWGKHLCLCGEKPRKEDSFY